jgi:hypothetical protein
LTVVNQAQIANLTGTGTTQLSALNVTGTTTLADLNLTNISCSTLEASTYVRSKNTSNDTVSLLMTPSTDPTNPRRGVIRSASTAFGLDLETLGSNKAIRGSSDMITMSSLNTEGPAFVQVGSNTGTDRGKVKITANSDVELVSLLSEVNITALSNISLESLGVGFITVQSALGSVITSAPFGNVGIYSGLTTLPSLLPGIVVNSSTSLTLSSTLGTSITAGLLASSVTTPGDILIKATQTGGVGGAINIQALSTFPGITPPNAIALTTDVGVIALTSGAGGVAVTTGAGLVSVATGGGGIQLRTGVDVLLGSGGILLETLIGGPIQLIAATDAISMAASLGGVNIGTNSTSTVGQFTVFTSNNATGAATGNITMSTHGTGVLTGPGNVLIDATQAYTGNMSLYSKGTLQITSNNTASGSVSNTTGGLYLDTSASSGIGQVYNWRFPSGPGTTGQVLSSNGSGTAQSWSNVPTISSGNISVNNVFLGFVTVTSLPYTMTVASPAETLITTVSSGNILLPDATTIPAGTAFTFNNNAAGGLSIQNASGATITTLPVGGYVTMFLTAAGTIAGTWDYHFGIPPNASWGTSLLSTGSAIKTSSVTQASALDTGSLIALGGASISKNLYAGGIIKTETTTDATALNTGSLIALGGASISKNLYVGGIVNITTQNAGALLSVNATNTGAGDPILSSFLSPSITGGIPTSYFGANTNATYNCASQKFFYFGNNLVNNYLELKTLNAANSFLIKGDLCYATGQFYTKGVSYLNWDQGVPNGSAAISVSPSVASGQASMDFRTDINAGGKTWRIGNNINSIGSDIFCFYNDTYNGNVAYFNNTGLFTVVEGIQAKKLALVYTDTTNTAQLTMTNNMTTANGSYTSFLSPTAAAGTFTNYMGANTATNNCVLTKFNYISNGGATNDYEMILSGGTAKLNVNPSTISIGTTSATAFTFTPSSGQVSLQGSAPGILLYNAFSEYTLLRAAPSIPSSNYTFTLPSSAGTAGQVLTSSGGSSALTWTNVIPTFTDPIVTNLSSSYTASTTILSLLQPSAADATYQIIALGKNIASNNCALIEFRYINNANAGNYLGIGTIGAENLFQFASGVKTFFSPKADLYGDSSSGTSVLNVANPFSGATTMFQMTAINSSTITSYYGREIVNRNCAEIQFQYFGSDSNANTLSLKTLGASNSFLIKGDLCYAQGLLYVKGQTFLNHDGGVPNGESALTISPSVNNNEGSIAFKTQTNAGGATWKIGHSIGGYAGDSLNFYSSTYGGVMGYMNTAAQFRMFGSVYTPQIYTANIMATGIDLDISTQTTSNGQKIFVHCGGYQTGGIYLNSWNATSSFVPNYGSTNIGNLNLGNSLFVGVHQENYLGTVSANGIINVCASLTNNQFMTFYSVNSSFKTPDTAIGSITQSIGNTVSYNTTSDYRIKENITLLSSALTIISQLKPRNFNYIGFTEKVDGFIAHEVQEIYPQVVTGEKDAVDEYGKPKLQQLGLANFTPLLTKAVQELHQLLITQQQTIAKLTTRLELLEQK